MIKDLPPLILDDEDRNIYYEALRVYDEKEEVEAIRAFIEFSLIKTWKKTLERKRPRYQYRIINAEDWKQSFLFVIFLVS